jgi:hypothetical protein
MQEKDLILKIKKLKEIKPNSYWVSSTRETVFQAEERSAFSFFLQSFSKPAMTTLASFGLIAVLTVSAQTASPGEALYHVKRITEKGRMALTSQDNKQDFNLLLAHRRLDEVSNIVKKNEIEKLSLAVKELESMKSKIQKDFVQSIESKPKEEVIKIARNFAPSVLEMEDKEDLLIGSLGVKVESELASSTAKNLAELLIEDYQERSLTENDQKKLVQAQEDFSKENYRSALRNVLEIGQEREKEQSEQENINSIKDPR